MFSPRNSNAWPDSRAPCEVSLSTGESRSGSKRLHGMEPSSPERLVLRCIRLTMAEPIVLALESAWTESGACVPSQTNRRLSRAAIVLLGRRGLASNAPAAEFTVNDGIPKPLRESGTYTRVSLEVADRLLHVLEKEISAVAAESRYPR